MSTAMEPKIVNGLNVTDLEALAAGIGENPANAETQWGVETEWLGQAHSRTRVLPLQMGGETVARDFTIDVDEPAAFGGENRYPNPQDHLLAGVNACILTTFAAQCALRGIELKHLSMRTEGHIDLRGFFGMKKDVRPGFESLSYTIRVEGEASPEAFEEVAAAVMATSPNFSNMANAIRMKPSLEVL